MRGRRCRDGRWSPLADAAANVRVVMGACVAVVTEAGRLVMVPPRAV